MSNKEQLQQNNETLAELVEALANNPTATELQRAIETHIENTENPHAVTYLQVGAAPNSLVDASYSIPEGTSDPEQMLEDIIQEVYSSMTNNTIKCISLNDNVGTIPLSGGHIFITIYKTNNEYGCLKAVKYGQNRIEKNERSLYGGVWGKWGCENPPMNPDIEYCTTERWKGLPVYKKLISYTLAERLESTDSVLEVRIPTGIQWSFQTIRCTAYTNTFAVLPFMAGGGGLSSIVRVDNTGAVLRIYKDGWDKGVTLYIELAYVKNGG